MFHEVGTTIEHDLVRAEMIALPITLLLLLFIFRSVVAAALPLAIGALSVVGTFLVLQVLVVAHRGVDLRPQPHDRDGPRPRHRLQPVRRLPLPGGAGRRVRAEPAVVRTVRTAGRTVAFSALTVAASLCALLVFPLAFLRSFAYAGVAVAVLAGLCAVVVLPALLAVLGHRVDALSLRRRAAQAGRARASGTGSPPP